MSDEQSVMEPYHARNVKLMAPFAYMANGEKPMIKYIPKGKRNFPIPQFCFRCTFCLLNRYAQVLEQQQRWLVNGIQKLYRRLQTGERWSADPLRLGANKHPLTHDILTAIGVLDLEQTVRREPRDGTVQQGWDKHMDECTEQSNIWHSPPECIPIQSLPMPHDVNTSSPEHQGKGQKADPDLTWSGAPDFDTTGIDDHLHLFTNSSFHAFDEGSLTTIGNHVDNPSSVFQKTPIGYFPEDSCISTDAVGLTPTDAGTVDIWPVLAEPFWEPFYSQSFPSESFLQ